jgi:hypothetical protein
VVRDLGATYDGGATLIAISAAQGAADLTTGEIEAGIAPTLLEGLRRFAPREPHTIALRKILLERHPPALDFARGRLRDPEHDLRMNALHLLKEAGRLSRTEEIAVHAFNLTTLGRTSTRRSESMAPSTRVGRSRLERGWARSPPSSTAASTPALDPGIGRRGLLGRSGSFARCAPPQLAPDYGDRIAGHHYGSSGWPTGSTGLGTKRTRQFDPCIPTS